MKRKKHFFVLMGEKFHFPIKTTQYAIRRIEFDQWLLSKAAVPMETHQLDGFISINNSLASYAAVAEYPALTVPMGYTNEGAPRGLTFVAKRLQEKQLLEWAYAFEQATKARVAPKNYN